MIRETVSTRKKNSPFSPAGHESGSVHQTIFQKAFLKCGELSLRITFCLLRVYAGEEPILEVLNIAVKESVINEKIRAAEVRVIDSDGAQLGVLKTRAALDLAYDKGLDLVVMSMNGPMPVCKIMDYGKYRFDREKKEKESRKKQVNVEMKEIKFSCRIGQHDFDTKLGHGIRFLQGGHRVKMTIMFSGREMGSPGLGFALMERIAAAVEEVGTVEKKPTREGRFMTMFVAPKK